MEELIKSIKRKKEKIKFKDSSNRIEHVFLTIINNESIFKRPESRILGLMIFNLCQDSLTATQIGNYNLVNHYKNRIEILCNKINEDPATENGINTIVFPMLSYFEYINGEFARAESYMIKTINALKQLSEILKDKIFPPLFEQHKNLSLIYFKSNDTLKGFEIFDILIDTIDKENLASNENIKFIKSICNSIIDEILLKLNIFDKANYKANFLRIINSLYSSKLYIIENELIKMYLDDNLNTSHCCSIIEADLPPIVEGTFLNAIKNCVDNPKEKQLIDKYFSETYNIAL